MMHPYDDLKRELRELFQRLIEERGWDIRDILQATTSVAKELSSELYEGTGHD